MRILFVGPNMDGDPPGRHLVERHMLGWANAASLTESADVTISVHMARSTRIDPQAFRSVEFHFEDAHGFDRYYYSTALYDMILRADIVHVFAPFTRPGEIAFLTSEALDRPVVATDYGLRATTLNVRSDVRHVIRNVVQPAELRRSPLDLSRERPSARSIVVPSAPVILPPNPAPQASRSGVLLVRPNLLTPDALKRAQAQCPSAQLFVFRDLMSLEDLNQIEHSWADFDIRTLSIGSQQSLFSFYGSLSEAWDLGGEILGCHVFLPDVYGFAVSEAAAWGAEVRRIGQMDAGMAQDTSIKGVGETLVRFYTDVTKG